MNRKRKRTERENGYTEKKWRVTRKKEKTDRKKKRTRGNGQREKTYIGLSQNSLDSTHNIKFNLHF